MSMATDMFQTLQDFRAQTGITHQKLTLFISPEKWDRLKAELDFPPTLGKWKTGEPGSPELFGLRVRLEPLLRGDQHVWMEEPELSLKMPEPKLNTPIMTMLDPGQKE